MQAIRGEDEIVPASSSVLEETAATQIPFDTPTPVSTDEPTGSPELTTADPVAVPEGTPSPEATATPDSGTTPEPEISETPTTSEEPTMSPEATATPSATARIIFSGSIEDASVSVETDNSTAEPTETSLGVTRLDAASDAEAYARYRTMLESTVSADQLDGCVIYELQYYANGSEIQPPQSAANLAICDAKLISAFAPESIQVFYLADGATEFSEQVRASINIPDNQTEFSTESCPAAIAVAGAPAPQASASPEPTALPTFLFEGDGLTVSGSPASPDTLPEGAELNVQRITKESDPERYALYADMLQQRFDTEMPIEFYAYDISFQVEGQEVEPVGDVVNVTITDETISEDVADPLVYHVVNEESTDPALQEIAAEATTDDGEAQVSFAADSFSTYILANGQQIVLSDTSGLTYKVIATEADTFTHTSYYDSSKALGIAGNFHIVAFNTATLGAHTNGNVLAKSVSANSNFGTNGLANELSYIQNYTQVNGTSATSTTHTLVVGLNNTITAMDNGNAFGINGTKLDKPKNLWQDQSTTTLPFIDLVALKASTKSLSSSLAGKSMAYITSHLSTSAGSCTESYLELTDPGKVGFYNITASALAGYSYFGVQGFQSGQSGTVIINVDCSGATGTITLPECRMYYGTGATAAVVNFAEVTSFVNGRVLWNLVNCTANVTTRLLYASLLAPDATVNIAQNMNGTVIANNVTISAESHRDDFIGELSNGVTVTGSKVWTDYGTGAPADTSVTFQLYRSTDGGVTKTAYGNPVTLNAATGWTYDWTELPTGSLYTITETLVLKGSTDVTASYAATYSTQTGVSSGTITVSNQYLYALPGTGGLGKERVTVIGGLLCLISAILWTMRNKRRKNASPTI